MKLENSKGTRDFLPEEEVTREDLTGKFKTILRRYGFNPLDTPAIEKMDVLAAKYAGGAEILKETFHFKDQGGRELGLRYDLTVPFSRVIGMNPQLKMPFKRYQIAKVWRDGPIKTGRYREFIQCDADVVGIKEVIAEAELISIGMDIFKELKMDVVVYINNRKLLNGIIAEAGINASKAGSAILSLDKLAKIGKEGVEKELKEKGLKKEQIQKLFELTKGEGEELIEKLKTKIKNEEGTEGLNELQELFKNLKSFAIKKEVVFLPSLARGLAYYTGTIFEVVLKKGEIKSAIAAGGRFDKMIGDYLGGNREYPAVGISFGFDVIFEALRKKIDMKRSTSTIYIVPIQTLKESIKVAQELRKAGINVDMDLIGKGVSKNLDYADKYGIPYSLLIGDEELKNGRYTLRDMKTGREKKLKIDEIIKEVKS